MNSKLPPEILNVIFKLVVKPYNPPTRDRTLSSFSLVCFNWSAVARRLLFETIRILNRRHCDLVIRGLNQLDELRYSVLHLGIHFQRDRYIDSELAPTPSRQVQKNMVSLNQFNVLLQLTPNILSLKLEYPTFTTLGSISLQLESLTSLTMIIAAYDTNLEALRSLIQISPRLKMLNLTRVSSDTELDPSIPPLPYCPQLKNLKLSNLDVLYQSNFFPSQTFIRLESLRITGLRQWEDETKEDTVPEIFKVAGPTLQLLEFSTDFKYIIKIFPYLTSLRILDSQILENPDDLFQYFPTTLEISKTISREPELQHYLNHPRSNLHLQHLSILAPSLLKLVPVGVKSVSIFAHSDDSESGSYESLIEELNKGLIPCRISLKRLEFYGFEDYMFERYQEEIIDEFAKLGIGYSYEVV